MLRSRTRRKCSQHPPVEARWVCEGCRLHLCGSCVRELALGDVSAAVCRRCKARCVPFEGSDEDRRRAEHHGDLSEALGYPIRGQGRVVLAVFMVCVTVVALVVLAVRMLLPIPLLSTLIGVVAMGIGTVYCLAHMLDVVRRTMTRPHEPYDVPEFDDLWDSIAFPALRFMAASLIAAIPGSLIQALAPSLVWFGAITHAALFPAVLLGAALREEWSSLSPARWWPVLRNGGGEYIVAAVVLLAVEFLLVCSLVLWSHFLLFGLAGAIGLYLMAVAMRVLGHLGRRLMREGVIHA